MVQVKPVGVECQLDHGSIGRHVGEVENAVKQVKDMVRTLVSTLQCRYGDTPSQVHDIDVWTGDRPCVATHGRLHACIIHACMLFQNFTKC